MREATVERYLRERVKEEGGVAIKLNTKSGRGWPDRIVMLPGGRLSFVEVKAPGRKATMLQQLRIDQINTLGLHALVIDSKEAVDEFLLLY